MDKIVRKWIMAGSLLASAILLMSGCAPKDSTIAADSSGDSAPDSKPVIAVTIVPETTFVKAVCGDLAEVITMIPPGNSPENYEPTPMQMAQFNKASLYFAIGVPAEANILPGAAAIKTVALQEKAAAVYPERTFASGGRDPHIWLSPKRVKVMIGAIADAMGEFDAKNKETYLQNAGVYISKLDTLDREIRSVLDGVRNKKIIVYHPAFGYLADDYGLTMYSLEEEGKESTARRLQEMIDFAKAEGIKVIFYQDEIDSSQSEAFAEEIGGKTMNLSPLSGEYIENLKKMAETMAEVMK